MTKLTKIYQFTLFMFVFSFPHLLPIYAASLYSSFSKLTGIEISETMTEISKKLGVPGEIITSDIRNVADKVVPESDVVIMNNVFEFFMEPEEELECWSRIFEFAKKGQIFVMVPALEQVFDSFGSFSVLFCAVADLGPRLQVCHARPHTSRRLRSKWWQAGPV